ncbi:MAG TPA: hypothetical protein VFF74_01335 [Methylophilaceae bacterium]|nr:hypothetical protein [Methylophilaceae bacterium]
MAIIKIETITKRAQRLYLEAGLVVEIGIELNAVGVYLNSADVGRLKFRLLMSANSAEASPLYTLDHVSLTQAELQSQAQEIFNAAVDLFKQYMGARIRLPKDHEALFSPK